jgi:hypothetical protein
MSRPASAVHHETLNIDDLFVKNNLEVMLEKSFATDETAWHALRYLHVNEKREQ